MGNFDVTYVDLVFLCEKRFVAKRAVIGQLIIRMGPKSNLLYVRKLHGGVRQPWKGDFLYERRQRKK